MVMDEQRERWRLIVFDISLLLPVEQFDVAYRIELLRDGCERIKRQRKVSPRIVPRADQRGLSGAPRTSPSLVSYSQPLGLIRNPNLEKDGD